LTGGTGELHASSHINLIEQIKFFFEAPLGGCPSEDVGAGVVNPNPNIVAPTPGDIHELIDGPGLAQIDDRNLGLRAQPQQLASRLFGRFASMSSVNKHIRSLRGQLNRDGSANAAGGAGHDGRLTCKRGAIIHRKADGWRAEMPSFSPTCAG
jgi:hypothetical protein